MLAPALCVLLLRLLVPAHGPSFVASLRRRDALAAISAAVPGLLPAPARAIFDTSPATFLSDLERNGMEMAANDVNAEDAEKPMGYEKFARRMLELNTYQIQLLLKAKTEPEGSGKFSTGQPYNMKDEGVFVQEVSQLPLFSSAAKYDSGFGWATFTTPIDASRIIERLDRNDMDRYRDNPERWRVQLLDKDSKTHIGHVFFDGPEPTGKRYRINAGAFRFEPGTPPPADPAQAALGWKRENPRIWTPKKSLEVPLEIKMPDFVPLLATEPKERQSQ